MCMYLLYASRFYTRILFTRYDGVCTHVVANTLEVLLANASGITVSSSTNSQEAEMCKHFLRYVYIFRYMYARIRVEI